MSVINCVCAVLNQILGSVLACMPVYMIILRNRVSEEELIANELERDCIYISYLNHISFEKVIQEYPILLSN